MIPKTLTEREVWTALKPFYDLIGVTPMHLYDSPRLDRDDDGRLHVRFSHVVEPGVEMDWPIGRTGDGPFDELTYDVDIVVRAGDGDPIEELWSVGHPEATAAAVSDV